MRRRGHDHSRPAPPRHRRRRWRAVQPPVESRGHDLCRAPVVGARRCEEAPARSSPPRTEASSTAGAEGRSGHRVPTRTSPRAITAPPGCPRVVQTRPHRLAHLALRRRPATGRREPGPAVAHLDRLAPSTPASTVATYARCATSTPAGSKSRSRRAARDADLEVAVEALPELLRPERPASPRLTSWTSPPLPGPGGRHRRRAETPPGSAAVAHRVAEVRTAAPPPAVGSSADDTCAAPCVLDRASWHAPLRPRVQVIGVGRRPEAVYDAREDRARQARPRAIPRRAAPGSTAAGRSAPSAPTAAPRIGAPHGGRRALSARATPSRARPRPRPPRRRRPTRGSNGAGTIRSSRRSSPTSAARASAAASFIPSVIAVAWTSNAPRKIPGKASTLLIWFGKSERPVATTAGVPVRDLGVDLGVGLASAEDDRVVGHRGDDLLGHRAAGDADVDVGAGHGRRRALPVRPSGSAVSRASACLTGGEVRRPECETPAGRGRRGRAPRPRAGSGHGDPGRAGARRPRRGRSGVATGEPQRVDEGGQDDDGGAVLVVVEHRDVEPLLEPVLDLEAPRRRDVLEVDAAEARREPGDRLDDLLDVGRVQADRDGVDAAELLEEDRLALHHRHGGGRTDVAEAQHRGAVGDDGHGVGHPRVVLGQRRVLGDRPHTRATPGV